MQHLFLIPFISCLILLLALRPVALRFGFVDRPEPSKLHANAVPLVGGIAIFAAIAITFLYLDPQRGGRPLFFDLLPLLLLGVVDDIWRLRPLSRLIVEVAVVTQLVLAHGVVLVTLGDLFGTGPVSLGWLSIPFTVFAFVGLLNAINLVDGLDGLAAGLVSIALVLLLMVAARLGVGGSVVMLGVATLGALLAFLMLNIRHPLNKQAKVFLGDAGSLVLGMILGAVLFKLTQRPSGGATMPATLALWVVALPLLDTCSVMIRRLANGKNPFSGDRQHLHHLLLEAGFAHGQATVLILIVASVLGVSAVLAWFGGCPEWLLGSAFVCLALAYLAWVFNPERAIRSLEGVRMRLMDRVVLEPCGKLLMSLLSGRKLALKASRLSTANKVLVGFAAMSAAVASAALGLSNSGDAARFEAADYHAVQRTVAKEIAASGTAAAKSLASAQQDRLPKSLVLQALSSESQQLPQDMQQLVQEVRLILLAQAESENDQKEEGDQTTFVALGGGTSASEPSNFYPNLGSGTSSGSVAGFTALVNTAPQSGGGVSPN